MVSTAQKSRATQYICDRLEESDIYTIQRSDGSECLEVTEIQDIREEPRTYAVIVANFLKSTSSFTHKSQEYAAQKTFVVPVLYKDGETAFVRMVDRNKSWRTDKSLKRYTPQQINHMLHLRKIEKMLMDTFNPPMVYYQPPTERLEELLRRFTLEPVELDYSHIGPGDSGYGFVHDRDSIDYKLPVEGKAMKEAVYCVAKPEDVERRPIKFRAALCSP